MWQVFGVAHQQLPSESTPRMRTLSRILPVRDPRGGGRLSQNRVMGSGSALAGSGCSRTILKIGVVLIVHQMFLT